MSLAKLSVTLQREKKPKRLTNNVKSDNFADPVICYIFHAETKRDESRLSVSA